MDLNQLDCLQAAGNTGVGSCFVDIQKIVGAFLTPKGWEVDITDLQANLIAATHASSKALRIFPIYDFKTITDGTEKPVIQSFPDGSKAFVRDGFNDWMYQFVRGGASLTKELRKFNKYAYDFMFIDADGKLLGIKGSTTTKLRAFPSDGGYFLAQPWKQNDGSKVTEYACQFVFNSKYTADLVDFVLDTSFDILSTIRGLQNVIVTGVAEIVPVGAVSAFEVLGIGSNADSIDVKVNGTSISGGPVSKTSSESSLTLLATKIYNAINTAATFTATDQAAGIFVIHGPAADGAALNGVEVELVIVGGITATAADFSGGVTGGAAGSYDVTVKTEATQTNLYDLFPTQLASASKWIVTNTTTGGVITVSGVTAGSSTQKFFKIALNTGDADYPEAGGKVSITLATPSVLQAAGIDGYEAIEPVQIVIN